jgi:hypothetical protein
MNLHTIGVIGAGTVAACYLGRKSARGFHAYA